MLFCNALIQKSKIANTHNTHTHEYIRKIQCKSAFTNLIEATCWKQCGCSPHRNSRMSQFKASSSPYANYFQFSVWCFQKFVTQQTQTHSLPCRSLSRSWSVLARARFSINESAGYSFCKTLPRVCMLSPKWERKLRNPNETFSNFHVRHNSHSSIGWQACICRVCYTQMTLSFSFGIFGLLEHSKMHPRVCICERGFTREWKTEREWVGRPFDRRYIKICDIWKWTF